MSSPVIAGSRRHTLEIITHLVAREFRIRYQRSVFGWLWSIGQPLSRFLVLSFVFTKVLPLDVPNYPLFLFAGLIGWTWFSAAVASATRSVSDRRELLLRPGLPRSIIPVVSVLSDGLDYLAALPVLIVFLVIAGELHLTVLALPLVLLPMMALALGIGFATCAANVYIRDVHLVTNLVLLLGFYVTPVFYSPEIVPEEHRWFLEVNPLTWALEAQRAVLVEGRLPGETFLPLVLVSLVTLAGGYLVFRRASRTFADEV
jgi:lipopolysaccharide transport system permease protein